MKAVAQAPLQSQILFLPLPACAHAITSLLFLKPILEPVFFHAAFNSIIPILPKSCCSTLLPDIIDLLTCLLSPPDTHTHAHQNVSPERQNPICFLHHCIPSI